MNELNVYSPQEIQEESEVISSVLKEVISGYKELLERNRDDLVHQLIEDAEALLDQYYQK